MVNPGHGGGDVGSAPSRIGRVLRTLAPAMPRGYVAKLPTICNPRDLAYDEDVLSDNSAKVTMEEDSGVQGATGRHQTARARSKPWSAGADFNLSKFPIVNQALRTGSDRPSNLRSIPRPWTRRTDGDTSSTRQVNISDAFKGPPYEPHNDDEKV